MRNIAVPRADFDIYIARDDTQFGEREVTDSLTSIYESGFLPYSGTKDLKNTFYSARSARVVLAEFVLSSENRRIAKKFDGMFERTVTTGAPPHEAADFCLAYFANKHGARAMPHERLEVIFSQTTRTVTYSFEKKPVAYVVEVAEGSMAHFWFSFYDLAYAQQSLGLWLMLDCIRHAKAQGLTHYYLGTVYGEKALYKTNFTPLEWWDGSAWNKDRTLLKDLSRG